MHSIRVFATRRAALALGLVLTGCGEARDNLPREAVSGKVSIDGSPVARGSILFRSSGGGGMDVGGLVQDGRYQIPKSEGPVPGAYQVSITEAVDRAPQDMEKFTLQPKTKPSRGVVNTPLDAEVKKGGPNTLDFDFKKTTATVRPKGPHR